MNGREQEREQEREQDLQPMSGAEASAAISIRVQASSDVGLVRTNNQDSAYVSPSMIALADGMGGAAAGDLASSVAINALAAVDKTEGTPAHRLRTAITNAYTKLSDLISWNPTLTGLGTTIEAAIFTGSLMSLAHLGDSRVYLLREHELSRLTHDHSLVQELLDSGEITAEEAELHPRRSLLMRVLNGTYMFKPVFSTHELQLGDRLLFCSDGLSGQIDDDDLVTLLGNPNAAKTLESLHRAVYAVGAPDNLTIVVADVVESNAELDSAPARYFGAVADTIVPDVPHIGRGELGVEVGVEASGQVGGEAPVNTAELDDIAWFDAPLDPDLQASDVGGRKSRVSESRTRKAGMPAQPGDITTLREKRGLLVGVSVVFAVLALIAASLWGGRHYLSNHYFIGDDDGNIAIFQGLPERVVGIPLNWVAETSNTNVADLPAYYAAQVSDGNLRPADIAAARVTLAELEAKAAYCRSLRPDPANPSGTPAPTSGISTPNTPQTTTASSTASTQTSNQTRAAPTGAASTGTDQPTDTQTTQYTTPPPATAGPEDCP